MNVACELNKAISDNWLISHSVSVACWSRETRYIFSFDRAKSIQHSLMLNIDYQQNNQCVFA